MKNQTLSIEQMKHLKSLGVDTSKASMVCLFIDEDGNEVDWDLIERHGSDQTHYYFDDEYEHDNGEFGGWILIAPRFYDAKTGYYDHSSRESCGVFTLQDMLEMMPASIFDDKYFLTISFDELLNPTTRVHTIRYSSVGMKDFCYFEGSSLLNATYQMLCWLAQNEYLKGGKP